jgi:hypothetical protein
LYELIDGEFVAYATSGVNLTETVTVRIDRSNVSMYNNVPCNVSTQIDPAVVNGCLASIVDCTILSGSSSSSTFNQCTNTFGAVAYVIDSITIEWSNLSTQLVTTNNQIVTSPVTGLDYQITNLDTCASF